MQPGRGPAFQGMKHFKFNAGAITKILKDSNISKTKSEARSHRDKVDGDEGPNEEDNGATTPDGTEDRCDQDFHLTNARLRDAKWRYWRKAIDDYQQTHQKLN
jgi:hypothetical protein